MTTVRTIGGTRQWKGGRLWKPVLALVGLVAVARAAPPIDPLPAPLFSFDLESPSVLTYSVDPAGILTLNSPHPYIVVSGSDLGLGEAEDELDAMSLANVDLPLDATFAILFSVDRDTVGVATPDPDLVALEVPYNVLDQALRGQAAGDQFMSTTLYTREGRATSLLTYNNTLVRNNFDEGGTDFAALPATSAGDIVVDEPQDRVDATLTTLDVTLLYYSASATSPSLETLPAWEYPSGAHVFYLVLDFGEPGLFASCFDLGLEQEDDIDALLVFDTNNNGAFDGSDQVLFSLTPSSPSLATIPGASTSGAAADIFVTIPGEAPVAFAQATLLGLGHQQDNMDALDYVPCDDAEVCAAIHGIRRVGGDFDNDGDVDEDDFDAFQQCFSGPDNPFAPDCEAGDFDGDGDIDCDDWEQFCQAWTAGGSPPELSQCPRQQPIPAVSEWGIAVMTLLTLAAGTLVFRKRGVGGVLKP
jgi:hypothetical protein